MTFRSGGNVNGFPGGGRGGRLNVALRRYSSWLLALLGMAVFALCLWITDLPSPSLLLRIDLRWLAVGILAQGGLAVMMPWRWIAMSRGAGIRIPYLPACRLTAYMSLAGAVIPQSVADLGGRGVWAARRTGSSLLDACNVVLCDRLLDVYAIGLFLPSGVAYAYGLAPPGVCAAGAAGMALLGFAVLYCMKGRFFLLFDLCFRCVRLVCDLLPPLRGRFHWHVSPVTLDNGTLIAVYAVSMLKFGLITLGTLAYFKAVHIDVPVALVFFALPITQFVFIFAMTPGGLGIFELGWVGVLSLNGLPDADIGLFLVSQRLCATLAVLVWAALAFVLIRKSPLKETAS